MSINKKMKTLIFDFDGTLVDSMNQYASAIVRVLDENHIKYPDDIIKITTPLGYEGAAKYFVEELGMKQPIESIIARMRELALWEYENNILAKATVKEALRALKADGYSLNVLTASPHVVLDVCLKRNELYELFENVWSCDDFNTTKSDVNIYHKVAECLNDTVENCVFLDDNVNALTVAKQAGMTVIGVYDESSIDYKEAIIDLAFAYVDEMQELVPIMRNF